MTFPVRNRMEIASGAVHFAGGAATLLANNGCLPTIVYAAAGDITISLIEPIPNFPDCHVSFQRNGVQAAADVSTTFSWDLPGGDPSKLHITILAGSGAASVLADLDFTFKVEAGFPQGVATP